MRQQDCWRRSVQSGKRSGPVDCVPGPIIDTGELQRVRSALQGRVNVIHHCDVLALQSTRRQFRIGVVIVIAEHGPNSLGRMQRCKRFGARLDETSIRRRVIAREHEYVRLGLLGQRDDAAHFIETEDATVMNVGELCNAKVFEALGKIANEDVGFGDPIAVRFDEPRVS